MKKRILSILLCLCIVIALLPTMAFAAEPQTIGTFDELKAAFTNGGEYTLTANITVTEGLSLASTKTLTINGGNHVISPAVTGLNEQGIVNDDAIEIDSIILNRGTLTLKNLTIYGGEGRCICNYGDLTMSGVSLERAHNTSTYGTGLYNGNSANAVLTNCNIRRNGSEEAGGGFYNKGTLIMENCSVVENRNFGTMNGGGAGENGGTMYMNNCTVANNQSSEIGGGINNYIGTAYIMNSTFTGNISTDEPESGGGIGCHGGNVYVVNSVFAFNYAGGQLSDIGIYSRTGIYLYNCAYGKIIDDNNVYVNDVSTSDCKDISTVSITDLFSGARESGVVDEDGKETTQKYNRPVILKSDSTYGVFPKADSALLTGGTATYYDRDATVKMAYGSEKEALGSLDAATTQVNKYQDGADRATNSTVIGALLTPSGNVTAFYTVKVNPATGGSVEGGSALGDSYASGTSVSITAVPDTDYTFSGWKVGSEETASVTTNPYVITSLTSDVVLTPVFEESAVTTYDVTFVTAHGTAPQKQTINAGGKVTEPAALSKTGYTFGGWYADGSTTAWDFNENVVNSDIKLTAKWTVNKYDLKVVIDGNTTTTEYAYGAAVTAPTAPSKTGYTFKGWGREVPTTMPAEDVTLTAQWDINKYTVSFSTNGGSAVTAQTVEYNKTATEPTKPTKAGYVFMGWYTDSALKNEYDFSTAVTGNITLYAKWYKLFINTHKCEYQCEVCMGCMDPNCTEIVCRYKCPGEPFADVADNEWYTKAIEYVYLNALMDGITDTMFYPDKNVSRAMVVQVLYNLEGKPAVNSASLYTDVDSSEWYADAVAWASMKGIVEGYNGKFNPEKDVTREQLATILWRYAKYKGWDVRAGENTNILSYVDVSSISEYAVTSMKWAVGEGVIGGLPDSKLGPRNGATRAQLAQILYNMK